MLPFWQLRLSSVCSMASQRHCYSPARTFASDEMPTISRSRPTILHGVFLPQSSVRDRVSRPLFVEFCRLDPVLASSTAFSGQSGESSSLMPFPVSCWHFLFWWLPVRRSRFSLRTISCTTGTIGGGELLRTAAQWGVSTSFCTSKGSKEIAEKRLRCSLVQ